jgi:hypothetical protein
MNINVLTTKSDLASTLVIFSTIGEPLRLNHLML